MNSEAWPFVVTRNSTLDWRPIAAPPFVIDARTDFLLVRHTAGDGAHPVPLTVRHVDGPIVGSLTLAFRSRAATRALLADSRDQESQLRDRFGRPVFVVEGLALRGDVHLEEATATAAIDRIQTITTKHFPSFWCETNEAALAIPTASVEIQADRTMSVSPTALGLSGRAVAWAIRMVRRLTPPNRETR
ncbi:hypothetical protein [Rhodococcus sp. T7]|uniref:hypothetical protein n=1 Tax=Rhodococcus sp. T7 TaxID=627444 RepID=UPI001358D9E5|nr:hypothetical protein [Rhodococcus sp. T7]KAF0957313.1 hypothetical protein MLGJGCBP_09143 [Rhodococcus sp. T7]KAF0959194.1 hypothetical protein MLGJGCBP_07707 [Rhodococcus sp. T7]